MFVGMSYKAVNTTIQAISSGNKTLAGEHNMVLRERSPPVCCGPWEYGLCHPSANCDMNGSLLSVPAVWGGLVVFTIGRVAPLVFLLRLLRVTRCRILLVSQPPCLHPVLSVQNSFHLLVLQVEMIFHHYVQWRRVWMMGSDLTREMNLV